VQESLAITGEQRDAGVNFDAYRGLQQHRAILTAIARLSYPK